MKTLTIRGLPDEVHEKLKMRAKRNRRSLNQEVIAELDRAGGREADEERCERVEKEIQESAVLRGRATGFWTAREIDAAKSDGRA